MHREFVGNIPLMGSAYKSEHILPSLESEEYYLVSFTLQYFLFKIPNNHES